MTSPIPRWFTQHGEGHAQWFIDRFRTMADDGVDLAGEARLLDAMLRRNARVLDAGCGSGRVGGVLHAMGHTVVGVDVDPELIAAAETDAPGPRWLVADLATLDLAAEEPFDAVVCAGNVLPFVAPDTEGAVVERIGAHLVPDGFAAIGFGLDRGYPLAEFDRHVADAGLLLEHRFATWDLRPWRQDAGFAVSVLRKPA